MPINSINSTTIHVSDQQKALDFYTGKLGFEKRRDERFGQNGEFRWLEVAPPDSQSVLILAAGFGAWEPDRIGKFTGVVLGTADMKSTYEELSGRGVKFTETPSMQPWGMMQAQFEDQDGNGYVLVGS